MRTPWERRSHWHERTFKPIQPQACPHTSTRLEDRLGWRVIVCQECGKITHRRPLI